MSMVLLLVTFLNWRLNPLMPLVVLAGLSLLSFDAYGEATFDYGFSHRGFKNSNTRGRFSCAEQNAGNWQISVEARRMPRTMCQKSQTGVCFVMLRGISRSVTFIVKIVKRI